MGVCQYFLTLISPGILAGFTHIIIRRKSFRKPVIPVPGTRIRLKSFRDLRPQLGLLFIFMTVPGILLLALHLKTGPPEAAARHLLEESLGKLEESHSYPLHIQERHENYRLDFSGQVVNPGKLTGVLENYDLEVYQFNRHLFIKNTHTGDWETVKEARVEDLESFIVTPGRVLEIILDNWEGSRYINWEIIEGTSCQLITYLPPEARRKEMLYQFYPRYSPADLKDISFFLWVEEETSRLLKISLTLQLEAAPHGFQQITREMVIAPG